MQVLEINSTVRVDLNGGSWQLVKNRIGTHVIIRAANGISYNFFNDWSDTTLADSEGLATLKDVEAVFTALDELIRPKVMTAFWITKADVIEKAREIKAKRENLSANMVDFKDLAPGTVG